MRSIKVLSILVVIFLLSYSLKAQITLERKYLDAATGFYMVNLELSGMKYIHKSDVQGYRFLKFYNLDHSLWKTIDCNSFPIPPGGTGSAAAYKFDALYISETLFNCDSAVEFLYSYANPSNQFTAVYKEDGTALLVADSCAPLVKVNIPQQFRPIYNTPQGTKLILSDKDGYARVYNLPCNLSVGIDQMKINSNDAFDFELYPNPSFYESCIKYSLPIDVENAKVLLFDVNGKLVKEYKVDNSFNSLFIDQREIPAGTYFYSIATSDKVLATKTAIILK